MQNQLVRQAPEVNWCLFFCLQKTFVFHYYCFFYSWGHSSTTVFSCVSFFLFLQPILSSDGVWRRPDTFLSKGLRSGSLDRPYFKAHSCHHHMSSPNTSQNITQLRGFPKPFFFNIGFDPWQASANTPNLTIRWEKQRCLWFFEAAQLHHTLVVREDWLSGQISRILPLTTMKSEWELNLNGSLNQPLIGQHFAAVTVIHTSIVKILSRWTKYVNGFIRIDTFFLQ